MALHRWPDKHPSATRAYPILVAGLGTNTIGVVSSVSVPAGLTFTTTASGNRVTVLTSSGVTATLYQIETTINISNGEILIVETELMVVNN